MNIPPQAFRQALGRFASSVCVITTIAADGKPAGVTISAFCSVSLRPPLILFCIGKRSVNLNAWLTCPVFCVNVLGEGQERLAETFAQTANDRFAGVPGKAGSNGCFCIDGCLVSLECRRTSAYDEGDHHIIVGSVEQVHIGAEGGPLLHFRAAYRRLG